MFRHLKHILNISLTPACPTGISSSSNTELSLKMSNASNPFLSVAEHEREVVVDVTQVIENTLQTRKISRQLKARWEAQKTVTCPTCITVYLAHQVQLTCQHDGAPNNPWKTKGTEPQ